MKNQFLTFSMLSDLTGCAAATPAAAPAGFAGTKWNQIISFLGEHNTLEFVDDTTCVYTFYGDPERHTYEVTGDTIKFAGDTYIIKKKGDEISFENTTDRLKNDTLLFRGIPYWAKE